MAGDARRGVGSRLPAGSRLAGNVLYLFAGALHVTTDTASGVAAGEEKGDEREGENDEGRAMELIHNVKGSWDCTSRGHTGPWGGDLL